MKLSGNSFTEAAELIMWVAIADAYQFFHRIQRQPITMMKKRRETARECEERDSMRFNASRQIYLLTQKANVFIILPSTGIAENALCEREWVWLMISLAYARFLQSVNCMRNHLQSGRARNIGFKQLYSHGFSRVQVAALTLFTVKVSESRFCYRRFPRCINSRGAVLLAERRPRRAKKLNDDGAMCRVVAHVGGTLSSSYRTKCHGAKIATYLPQLSARRTPPRVASNDFARTMFYYRRPQ